MGQTGMKQRRESVDMGAVGARISILDDFFYFFLFFLGLLVAISFGRHSNFKLDGSGVKKLKK